MPVHQQKSQLNPCQRARSISSTLGLIVEQLRLSGISPTPSQNPSITQPCATCTPTMSESEFQMKVQERKKKLEAPEDKLECMIMQKSQNDPTAAYCEWLQSPSHLRISKLRLIRNLKHKDRQQQEQQEQQQSLLHQAIFTTFGPTANTDPPANRDAACNHHTSLSSQIKRKLPSHLSLSS